MQTITHLPAPEPDPEEPQEETEPTPAAEATPERQRREIANHEAAGWLYRLLLHSTGMEMALEDIRPAAAERGYSDRLLRSAAQKIGAAKVRLNGNHVAYRLVLDPADAAPVPPKVVGQAQPETMPTLADVQRVFDGAWREFGGRKIPGIGLASTHARMQARDAIAKEMRKRLARLGVELPELTADGDPPLASAAAAICNGGRPIATLDSVPGVRPGGPDTRVQSVRVAETALAAAEKAYAEARRHLDRERAGAAT